MSNNPLDSAAGMNPATADSPRPRRSRLRRVLIVLGVLGVLGVIAAELAARYLFRLGDPPLFMADAQIEYVMVPSRTYHRFYATTTYNKWSMRATPDIEKTKADPRELRVLVIGDSVINGGPQTDDRQLATTRAKEMLSTRQPRPVVVANVSAGSWGPPNLLAYAKKHGLFAADVVVMVLNHEDAEDVPTFGPLGPEQPTRTPVLALEEVVFRYIPSFLADRTSTPPPPVVDAAASLTRQDACNAALRELVTLIRASGARPVAILHASRTEVTSGEPRPGTQRLRGTLESLGVPVVDDTDAFRNAHRSGQWVYRDDIHIMPEGQQLLAEILVGEVVKMVP